MVGPGGRVVEPVSESKTLDGVIDKLHRVLERSELRVKETAAHRGIVSAIADLEALLAQVAAGYHRNPGLVIYNPPMRMAKGTRFQAGDVVGLLSKDVLNIQYRHASDGELYEHPFEGGAEMYCVTRAGQHDVLLTGSQRQPLWEDF